MATPKRLPSQAESLDQRKFRYSAFEEQLEWEGLQKDNHSAESLHSNNIGVLSTGSPIWAALKLQKLKIYHQYRLQSHSAHHPNFVHFSPTLKFHFQCHEAGTD